MAAATITFDNSEGWLPIDYAEVSVGRRAHRDGQNEYLLNGQRVRLRDIQELLGSGGLAERTYTIVGQGLVDSVLSLRAEERSKLFEEAAGITIHRVRREESLRRLEKTRLNLDRVKDVSSARQSRPKHMIWYWMI
jgi:chromosome segregation protein